MAGPTIAHAEVSVDLNGRGLPAQARAIADRMGRLLTSRMVPVGRQITAGLQQSMARSMKASTFDRWGFQAFERGFVVSSDGTAREVVAIMTRVMQPRLGRLGDEAGRQFGRRFTSSVGDSARTDLVRAMTGELVRVIPQAADDAGFRFGHRFTQHFTSTVGDSVGKELIPLFARRIENDQHIPNAFRRLADRSGDAFVKLQARIFMALQDETPTPWLDIDEENMVKKAGAAGRRAGHASAGGFGGGFGDGMRRLDFGDAFGPMRRAFARSGEDSGRGFLDRLRHVLFPGLTRSARLIVTLIAGLGPQLAALGSGLGGVLTGVIGSAVVGLGGFLVGLGGPLAAATAATALLATGWAELITRSAPLGAAMASLTETWKEQAGTLGDQVAPAVAGLLDTLAKALAQFDVSGLSRALSTVAGAFQEMVTGPGFTAFLAAMTDTLPTAFGAFFTGLASLTGGFLRLFADAGPAMARLAEGFEAFGARFAASMEEMSASGQLGSFFDKMVQSIDTLLGVLSPLSVALGNVFLIGHGPAEAFAGILVVLSERFLEFTRSAEGITAITQWFEQANVIGEALLVLFGSVATTLADMVTPNVVAQLVGFINALSGFTPILGEMLSIIGEDLGVLSLFGEALNSIAIAVRPVLPVISEFAQKFGQGLLDVIVALTPALSTIAGVIGQLTGPLGRVVSGLTDFSSATNFAETAARLLPGAIGDIGIIISQLMGTIADALPGVVTALTGVFEGLGTGLVRAFREMGPALGRLLGVVAEQLANLLPEVVAAATVAFGGLVDGLKAAIPAFTAALPVVADAIADLVPSLLAGALELVAALVDGLADNAPAITEALVDLLRGAVKALTRALPLLAAAAGDLVSGLAEGLLENLPALIKAMGGLIEALLLSIGTWAPQLIVAAGAIIGALVVGLQSAMPSIIEGLTALLPTLQAAFDALAPDLINIGVTILTAFIQGIITNHAAMAKAMADLLPVIQDAVNTFMPQMVDIGVQILLGVAKGLADNPEVIDKAMRTIALAIIETFKNWLGISSPSTVFQGLGVDILNGLIQGLKDTVGSVITFFRELPGRILEQVSSLAGRLKTWASDGLTKAREGFEEGIRGLVKDAGSLPTRIATAVGNLGGTLRQAGRDLIGGLIAGIADMGERLLARARGIANTVVATLNSAFGNNSPSKVARQIGVWVVQGLQDGIDAQGTALIRQVAALGREVTDNLTAPLDTVGSMNINRPAAAGNTTTTAGAGSGAVVEAGAIQIFTQTTDPAIAANMVLDRLVARLA